jgi:hypothetical protein
MLHLFEPAQAVVGGAVHELVVDAGRDGRDPGQLGR